MNRPRLRIGVALLLSACTLTPATADAQFRYLLGVDLRETYNSNVFAGVSTADWDMVSELEPSLRFYYNMPRTLLWARYAFLFQLYARTQDPAAGRRLLGFANDLQLELTHLFGPVTAFRVLNRFNQGTENTSISSQASDAGQLSPGYLTSGSKFLTDELILELQHLINNRWGVRPRISGSFYTIFDRAEQVGYVAPPTTWTVAAANRVEFAPSDTNLFLLDLGFNLLNERRDIYPVPLYTYFGEASVGWRHFWSDFLDTSLSAGVDYRSRQLFDETDSTGYYGSWGPLGAAMLRYRYGRTLYVALEYRHRYETLVEFAESTTADTDEVGLAFDWVLGDWRIQSSAYFRYLRATTRRSNVEEPTATKVGRFDASLAYRLYPGVSIEEVGYQLEMVRDQLVAQAPTQPPAADRPPTDYDRHMAMVGISVAWPPPPPQDVRLNRRESEYEPVFNLVGGEEQRLGAGGAGGEERVRTRDRERQRQRRDGLNPFDADGDENPVDPSRPPGSGTEP